MKKYLGRTLLVAACLLQFNALAQAEEIKKTESTAAAARPAVLQAAVELAAALVDETRSNAMATTLINATTSELVTKNPDVAMLNSAFPGLDGAFRSALAGPIKNEVSRVLSPVPR